MLHATWEGQMLLFLSWIGMVHASGVVINEALVDPDGADGGFEWLELYNASDVEVSLSGWQLQAGTSSYKVDVTFDDGVVIAAKSFLVVGESSVDFADIESSLSFGNAGSSADSIQLPMLTPRWSTRLCTGARTPMNGLMTRKNRHLARTGGWVGRALHGLWMGSTPTPPMLTLSFWSGPPPAHQMH